MIKSIHRYIKENLGAIIVMALLSILIILFQPIIDLLRSMLVAFLVNTSTIYSNYLYILAAKNDPNLLSELSASFSLYIYSFVLAAAFGLYRYRYERQINNDKRKKHSKGKLVNNANKRRGIIIGGMAFILIIQLMIFFDWATYTSAHKINLKFRNDLIAIDASGKDRAVKNLWAEWVHMKSKNDYKIIYNKIDALIK